MSSMAPLMGLCCAFLRSSAERSQGLGFTCILTPLLVAPEEGDMSGPLMEGLEGPKKNETPWER